MTVDVVIPTTFLPPTSSSPAMARSRPTRTRDWTVIALLAVVAVALGLRLVGLGDRMAHFDEARVAHDALRYHKTGVWVFEPVVHGPFLPKFNDLVFGLLGPNDTSMRLVAAVAGGLAPLAAWLFRRHLRREELLAFAAFLAVNPILLYYSRFMRNDVPVAVVMLFALGVLVRAADTRRSWYLYPVGLLVALGLSMKGNAILYPIAWAGALGVVGYVRYVGGAPVPTVGGLGDPDRRRRWMRSTLPRLRPWIRDGVAATGLGLGLLTVLYAPRGPDELGLTDVLVRPTAIPAYVDGALLDAADRMVEYWVYSGSTDTPFLSYFIHYVETLQAGAIVVGVFALIGVVAAHLHTRQPRGIVLFGAAWGVASVLGYPVAADIRAPWLTVHAVIPLALPAAVGLGFVLRSTLESVAEEDWIDAALAGLVLVAAAGLVVSPAYAQVYDQPADEDNQLVQYAQPGGDWGDTIERMHALVAANDDGVDVLFVGEKYAMVNESDADHKPASGGWYDRLPLPWYTEQVDAVTASVRYESQFDERFRDDPPPVIFVDPSATDVVEGHLEGYEHRRHLMRLWAVEIDVYLAPA